MSHTDLSGGALGLMDVQAWVQQHGVPAQFHHCAHETPTVGDAARALGVAVDQVIKSLVFLAGGRPYVVIGHGAGRVEARLVAGHLGLPKRQVRLASFAETLAATGYPPGVVPPFAHREQLPTLLDQGILGFDRVYGGCGDPLVLISLPPAALVAVTEAQVVSVMQNQAAGA